MYFVMQLDRSCLPEAYLETQQVGAVLLQLSQVFLKIWCDLLTTVVRLSCGCCMVFLTEVARSLPPPRSKCIIDGEAEPDFSQDALQARVK